MRSYNYIYYDLCYYYHENTKGKHKLIYWQIHLLRIQIKRRDISRSLNKDKVYVPNTSIADDSNSHACGETSESTGETRREMSIAIEEVVRFSLGVNSRTDDDGDDEAVNTKHTSHNHRNDRLHHQLRPHHPHRRHSHAALSRPVRRSHTWKKKPTKSESDKP